MAESLSQPCAVRLTLLSREVTFCPCCSTFCDRPCNYCRTRAFFISFPQPFYFGKEGKGRLCLNLLQVTRANTSAQKTLLKASTKSQLGHPPPLRPPRPPPSQNQHHIVHGISPASTRPPLPPLPVASRAPTQAAVKEASKFSLKQQEKN